jgi:hypothetical protein
MPLSLQDTPHATLYGAKRISKLSLPALPSSQYEVLYGQDARGQDVVLIWQTAGNYGRAPKTVARELRDFLVEMGAAEDAQHWHCYRAGNGGRFGEISMYPMVWGAGEGGQDAAGETISLTQFCHQLILDPLSMYRQVLHTEALGRLQPEQVQAPIFGDWASLGLPSTGE